MNFENDEEFEQFLSEVEEDLKAYNQERADAGLSTLGTPPAAGTGKPNNFSVPKDTLPNDKCIILVLSNLYSTLGIKKSKGQCQEQ